MKYQFDANGEITNVEPTINQTDFRAYPPEAVISQHGQEIIVQLCADLIGGRWEYFYRHVS